VSWIPIASSYLYTFCISICTQVQSCLIMFFYSFSVTLLSRIVHVMTSCLTQQRTTTIQMVRCLSTSLFSSCNSKQLQTNTPKIESIPIASSYLYTFCISICTQVQSCLIMFFYSFSVTLLSRIVHVI
jgi:hypothetical protein